MTSRDATDLRRASLRLALQFGGLILVLFALLGVITFEIVKSSQDEATDATLIDTDIAGSPSNSSHNVLTATITDGALEVSQHAPHWFPVMSLLDSARDSDDAVVVTRTEGTSTWAIRTDTGHGRVTQVAVNTSEDGEELARLAVALGVAGILAAVAAAGVSILMTRRAMRPMVQALALQRRFVMDASHELRTPLTLLSTRAQILRRQLRTGAVESPSDIVANGLEDILQDSRVLTEILEDLLLSADPRESAPRQSIDLNVVAREAVASAAPQAQEYGKSVDVGLATSPVLVEASRGSIGRLFTSLISNALDHANSVITVSVVSDGKCGYISVRDDGAGFSAGMSERAFDRFATSRAAAPLAGAPESPVMPKAPRHYGLGLALVAEVAARYGGRVEVMPHSEQGGAEIVVELPLSKK